MKKLSNALANKVTAGFAIFIAMSLLTFHFMPLPNNLGKKPFSNVLYSKEGKLLAARIAKDHQWRFPPSEHLPEKYIAAVTEFEDRQFFSHPGVNPFSILRAMIRNLKAGHVVEGGSTITMQLARLIRNDPPRTYTNKFIEMLLALKLEWHFSKNEILALYASHAPFGGNTVGIGAASWRYFGREIQHRATPLSWAEAALLAVLPNSPALIHPGRSREQLKAKRDRLLEHLHRENVIDNSELQLSVLEPLPKKPNAIPRIASHLLQTLEQRNPKQQTFQTTLDANLQNRALHIAEFRGKALASAGVRNLSLVVIDHQNFSTPIYIGNVTSGENKSNFGKDIDIAVRPRSTGSILKPLLYGLMLQDGLILPNTLVADVPTNFRGFTPENYDHQYRGAVPAKEALSRSLNIPAVRMLKQYGVQRFYDDLNQMGLSTLFRPSNDYGLSLILGGAEANLWELTNIYAQLIQSATNNKSSRSKILQNATTTASPQVINQVINQGAAWLTLEALLDVVRPGREGLWRDFSSSQHIAWKTGTSYGLRDAWAIGSNGRYTVGVWAGNADGEGIPNLSGLNTAAPTMFDMFDLLGNSKWIEKPVLAVKELKTCVNDGYLSNGGCETETSLAPIDSHFQKISPYNKTVQIDRHNQFRVHGGCEKVNNISIRDWFILPPIQEYYWKKNHHEFESLPPWREDCLSNLANFTNELPMDIIYPLEGSKVYIPIELSGDQGRVVFRASHRNKDATLFWHIDQNYLGETQLFHDQAIQLEPGWHKLVLVDNLGFRMERWFKVLAKSSA